VLLHNRQADRKPQPGALTGRLGSEERLKNVHLYLRRDALPLFAAAFVLASRSKRATFYLGNPRLVRMASGHLRAELLPVLMRLLLISLCLVAAARPQAGKKKVEQKKPVVDIFVALDVSSSMLADDLKPNRITAAKDILAAFLDKVEGVRVGLAVFAGRSFTQCPLTTDTSVVKKLLGNVQIFSVRIDGTAIGDGLASCVNRLKRGSGLKAGETRPGERDPKLKEAEKGSYSQAIVLLTDGENNQGTIDPLTAAKLAAREGITVHTIGVGRPEGVPAPYLLSNGRIVSAYDAAGDIIMTRLDSKLLKEISRLTGGKYYAASNNASLSAVLGEIARMEKRDAVTVSHWEYRELSPLVMAAVFALLCLEVLLRASVLRTLP
jgi:Ca-activated chloride channel family protein